MLEELGTQLKEIFIRHDIISYLLIWCVPNTFYAALQYAP